MRTFIILFCTTVFSFTTNSSFSQTLISIEKDQYASVNQVFRIIKKQTHYAFIIPKKLFKNTPKIQLKKGEIELGKLLKQSLGSNSLNFDISDDMTITIRENQPINNEATKAQKTEVNGIVTDQNGQPLPGANILEKGTTNGTQTDFDGKFSIKVNSENATLVVSYLGFATDEISLNGQTTLTVALQEDTSSLEEVVVVGYGTIAKKDITGSIATIKSDAITERSTTNVSNALQGSVAGLRVTRSSSSPGAGNTIRIRGNTTLQGSNDPLVLIDDVPGSINDVTPDQVESISVLKDAAAAAIYGSRAAAGVIIITTKRAKEGVFRFSYSGDYFINTPTKEREYVGALQYLQMDNEKSWNDDGNGSDLYPIWSEDRINKYITGEAAQDRNEYPDTDWAGLILKKNSTGYRHNINISGGTEKLKSNVFVGYEYQNALYNHRDWSRVSARINNDFKITDKFGAVADINFRLQKTNNPIVNPIGEALQSGPIYPALWEDGRYAEGKSGANIYLRYKEGGFSKSNQYLFTGRIGLYYKPIEDLKFTLNVTPTASFNKGKSFSKEVRYWDVDDPDQLGSGTLIPGQTVNRLSESRSDFTAVTLQALVNYDKSFGKHGVKVLGGFEERGSKSENLGVLGDRFVSPDFPYLNQATTGEIFNNGTSISELAYSSLFGRVNYSFDNKYYVSAAIRRDGSSRFGSDYRWGTFPSVSAAWTVSNEEFMKSFASPISYLKLKGSYGELGNDRLGNYLYLTLLQIQNTLIANGSSVEEVRALSQLYLTTPNVRWETTATKNIGLDLGLFNDKLSIEAEYFVKETKDMLLSLSVPDLVGFEDPVVNVGSMTTKGWELTTSWSDTIGDDFNYAISFNISDAESIIGDINGKRLFSGATLSEEGHEFQEFYGLQSDGFFQTQEEVDNSPVTNASVRPGDVKYKDLSGPDGEPDGVINDLDRTFLGSSAPRYIYGGRINMAYKGFDLGVAFQGVGKQNFYLSQTFVQPFRASWLSPSKEYASSYWSVNNTAEVNQNVKYPRLSETSAGNNYRFSDFWLKNGAYLRIKTIALGYTLPKSPLEKVGLTNLRLSITGNDLFTFDKLPNGVDPEQSSGTGYFLTKSFVVGLKANF
ncbi:SusC/RagA family TonB-linked outer membrane protein [Snuella sedimenti]|uniref:TonB-dependent receptor n=1 Tax=Snuella sedimenti TaxID=2798802 RepID=A0A8J7IEV6_9FLAO|nr:TonB-dependent receptor [Snuella sedimenti]MBJ6366992.1 TonB-dependent receptor [Snuella sedimenti]